MNSSELSFERAIAGALRSAIADHGPITPDRIGSAVKRIVGQLANARVGGLASALAKRRWSCVDSDERSRLMAAAGRASWSAMTAEERSQELRRRAQKRKPKVALAKSRCGRIWATLPHEENSRRRDWHVWRYNEGRCEEVTSWVLFDCWSDECLEGSAPLDLLSSRLYQGSPTR